MVSLGSDLASGRDPCSNRKRKRTGYRQASRVIPNRAPRPGQGWPQLGLARPEVSDTLYHRSYRELPEGVVGATRVTGKLEYLESKSPIALSRETVVWLSVSL